MPLNYQQVHEKIRLIGIGARSRQEHLEGLRRRTVDLLEGWADRAVELAGKVEQARLADPALRCAIPPAGRLDAALDPGSLHGPVTLLAADGSQVLPDRHAAVQYSLVNVGAIVLQPGSARAPETVTESRLLFGEELYTETGSLGEDSIVQSRDIAERRKLLELAKGLPAQAVVALTDGPVELWGAQGAAADEYRRNLEMHKAILSQLQAQGVTVAGYIAKPAADLLVRTLELATLTPEQLKDIRRQHPLRGVSDRWLFARLLGPGQRSAVFGLQSGSRPHYSGDLALHFFYLNAGSRKHPELARVEIPKWVADDAGRLDLLHTSLLEQCRMMGARPYPYILHRAHEVAVVRFEEKQQIEQMLALELRRAGAEVEERSVKQSAKDLPGKTRSK